MKRDLERIRGILLKCEASGKNKWKLSTDFKDPLDQYQIGLMADAGLVRLHPSPDTPKSTKPLGLALYIVPSFEVTWAGHDYIDATRDEGIWERTKGEVARTGGDATLEIIKALATGFLKEKIRKHTGVEL